jgi:hypothetical protein
MSPRFATLEDIAEKLLARSIPEPNSGCRLWEGNTGTTGYGVVSYNNTSVGAHRLSWMIHRGVIPAGLHVLHKCDVRECINPEHLFLGTPADNMRDMTVKGRRAAVRGSAKWSAKLTEADVLAIRAAVGRYRDIGERYGIGRKYVQDIKSKRRWKHI